MAVDMNMPVFIQYVAIQIGHSNYGWRFPAPVYGKPKTAAIAGNNKAQGMRAAFMPPEQTILDPNIQDPHRMVQCTCRSRSPYGCSIITVFLNHLIIRKAGRKLNRSHLRYLVLPCGCIPDDANTAWFVPGIKDECRMPVDGKLVVTRTRDGGKSFETLDKGLPKDHSSDLIYRHGLDIDTPVADNC